MKVTWEQVFREIENLKGSFIVASYLFSVMVLGVICWNILIVKMPVSIVEIGLALGAVCVIIWATPIMKIYFSQDTHDSRPDTPREDTA